MKNKTFNICLCVASFLILMFYLFKTVGLEELQQLMQSLAPSWLLGAVACMVLYWLLEARVLHLSLIHISSTDRSPE